MSAGQIPDLSPLSRAAGRELPKDAALLVFLLAREMNQPPKHRDTAKQADRIAKAATELLNAVSEAEGVAESLKLYVDAERLRALAETATLVRDRERAATGPGKRDAGQDRMLRRLAAAALDAWHRAGGTGLGVRHDEHQGKRVGPVLAIVRTALELAGAEPCSDSSIQAAIRGSQ